MGIADAGKMIDQTLVRAIKHPIRVLALEVLSEREASAKELSDEFGLPLSHVSYHVAELNKAGVLDEVRTQKRRGATEHFFRAIPRSFVGHWDWLKVPAAVQGAAAATSLGTFFNHAVFSLGQKGIAEAEETTTGWMTVAADEVGRKRLAAIAKRAIAEAEQVHEESLRRRDVR